jgi:hypothetical protein
MAFAILLGGCYLSTPVGPEPRDEPIDTPPCPSPPDVRCVRQEAGGCSRWVFTDAVCDELTDVWSCPGGSRMYERASPASDSCRPFLASPVPVLRSTGITLETGSGRCLWLVSGGGPPDGVDVPHLGAYVPDGLPFGACPEQGELIGGEAPRSIMDASELGPDALIGISDSIRHAGQTWIYYRHWVLDPSEPFFVRKLGTRLAVFDDASETIRLLDGFIWTGDEDYGDSALVIDGVPHLFGCHGPPDFMAYHCYLTRLAAGPLESGSGYEYFAGDHDRLNDQDAEAAVLTAGPHRFSARFHAPSGRYVQVFIAGFGDRIEVRTAESVTGPWTAPRPLVSCELPADDIEAFCGYPMLHPELADPARPDELVITYDIASLAPDGAERMADDPVAYWPRLVRTAIP